MANSLMKQVFFKLRVVYNDNDDMMMMTGITNHLQSQNMSVNLETNTLKLSQPWMCFQRYDKIKESMNILYTHVMILCKLLIFVEDD